MKLSEAIELGSTLDKLWTRDDTSGSCALMAASLAVGGHKTFFSTSLSKRWPWLWGDAKWECPLNCGHHLVYSNPAWMITHVFDIHVAGLDGFPAMTFDQFLDWLRSVEPAETATEAAAEQMTEAVEVPR